MDRDRIFLRINQAIRDGIFPGAVLLASVDHKIQMHQAFGMADIFTGEPVQKSSIFDLASLTKPLATTLALSRLIDDQKLSLNREIGSLLPEFKGSEKEGITIDMLLRHTSGYPAHREYFQQVIKTKKDRRQTLRKLLIREVLVNDINSAQVYSDLGFMVLSWIVEKISGQRLDRFVDQQIYAPLGIETLFFRELHSADDNENVQSRRKIAATQTCPWRNKLLKGEVDDDNAWAAGGVEGHAGLFGDAESVYTLCDEILNALQGRATKILAPHVIKTLVKRQDSHDMVAGFDTPSKENSSSGRYFSESSIGHLGFTGTSFWIDPEVSLVVVFLTNRVHPKRSNDGIKAFRPEFHDLVYTELI